MSTALAAALTAGPPAGEARAHLLFLHGFGGAARQWWPVMERLDDDVFSLAVDLPGHGECKLASSSAVERVTTLLLAALDAAGCPFPVAVVGHSLSGLLALHLATTLAPRVAWLGLVATAARVTLHPDLLRQFADGALDDVFLAGGLAGSDGGMVVDDFHRLRIDDARSNVWGVRDLDLTHALAGLALPSLVLAGRLDQVVSPRKTRLLAAGLSGSELVVLDGAGHYPHLERPGEVAAHLTRFIRSQDGTP